MVFYPLLAGHHNSGDRRWSTTGVDGLFQTLLDTTPDGALSTCANPVCP